MKKYSFFIVLVLSVYCLSCTTYTKVAVSLEAAKEKGKVQVESSIGSKVNFDNIEFSDNTYYGIKGNTKTALNQQEVSRVYLAEGNIHKAWVTLNNGSVKVKGYLYDATDTSLVVSSTMTMMENQSTISLNSVSIPVSSIKKIKLRKKGSVRKGYIIGTSIGIGAGAILGIASGDGGFTIFAAAGTLGIIGSLLGTPIGAITGTSRYKIKGNQDIYHSYKNRLKELSLARRFSNDPSLK